MRNEAPFILEWIAYHQHIGVTDFLIFSNDCEDGTDLLLDRLDAMGCVSHVRNHSRGKKTVQWRALNKARQHPLTKQADWIYVTDVDEFLCIHIGDGTIKDLLQHCPEADGFAIPWRMFGNNDIAVFEDKPVLQQFTKAAPDALLWPWRAVQFKSLFRNDGGYERLGVHRPRRQKDSTKDHWVDGNGQTLAAVPGTVVPNLNPRYGLAQINHYALGSIESFLVKVARGRPNHTSAPIDLAYWSDRNFNDVEDRRILRHQDAVAAGVKTLRRDPEIAQLHDAGVAWRKARIAALLRESDSFYMMARLRQMPATKVLPDDLQKSLFRGLMTVRQDEMKRKREAAKKDQ
ncbi:MAG: glycosyltransferase family 2 protein [Yoonia sp.]|uniref:glycosyltransferase family 2 protein n=1 Tax=Yoonia sp. TaxID=2212373 RepID=UPI00273D29A0|nr:glycosyltransferase family 2 protein [Yoonia sp.]MDP5083961.1 glycosyltransferase family 2 protein [Yoonia sp.]